MNAGKSLAVPQRSLPRCIILHFTNPTSGSVLFRGAFPTITNMLDPVKLEKCGLLKINNCFYTKSKLATCSSWGSKCVLTLLSDWWDVSERALK